MIQTYDQGDIRFAIWSGPGRDPQVAYLDERQMVVATSELAASGLLLHGPGVSYNVFGGDRPGAIEPAVLHRIAHVVTGQDGAPVFALEAPCTYPLIDGLCEVARHSPRPGTEADPRGSLVLTGGWAIEWVTWDDPERADRMRRAVYADDRYLVEAGTDAHGSVRAWPVHALGPFGLELVAPSASDLGVIEARIAETARREASDPPS